MRAACSGRRSASSCSASRIPMLAALSPRTRSTAPAFALGLVEATVAERTAVETPASLGAALAAAAFLALRWLYRRLRGRDGLGLGDVKLAASRGRGSARRRRRWRSSSPRSPRCSPTPRGSSASAVSFAPARVCHSRHSSLRRYGSSGCSRHPPIPSRPAVQSAGAAATVKTSGPPDRSRRWWDSRRRRQSDARTRGCGTGDSICGCSQTCAARDRWGSSGSLETGQQSRGRVRPPSRRSRRLDYDISVNYGRSRRRCYEFLTSARQSGPRLAGERWRPQKNSYRGDNSRVGSASQALQAANGGWPLFRCGRICHGFR